MSICKFTSFCGIAKFFVSSVCPSIFLSNILSPSLATRSWFLSLIFEFYHLFRKRLINFDWRRIRNWLISCPKTSQNMPKSYLINRFSYHTNQTWNESKMEQSIRSVLLIVFEIFCYFHCTHFYINTAWYVSTDASFPFLCYGSILSFFYFRCELATNKIDSECEKNISRKYFFSLLWIYCVCDNQPSKRGNCQLKTDVVQRCL